MNFLDYFEKYSAIYRQMSKMELIELLAYADALKQVNNREEEE